MPRCYSHRALLEDLQTRLFHRIQWPGQDKMPCWFSDLSLGCRDVKIQHFICHFHNAPKKNGIMPPPQRQKTVLTRNIASNSALQNIILKLLRCFHARTVLHRVVYQKKPVNTHNVTAHGATMWNKKDITVNRKTGVVWEKCAIGCWFDGWRNIVQLG